MNELTIIDKNNLPVTVEETYKYKLVVEAALKVQKAKLKAMENIDVTHEMKKAALSDTQDLADYHLDIEAKLGEMLDNLPKKPKPDGSSSGTFGGREKSLPPDINKKVSHQAQTIFRNPDIVEQIKQEARENDDIPTSRMVYQEIKKQKKTNQKKEIIKNLKKKLPDIEGKFDVIIVDPPWTYKKRAEDTTHRAANPYPDMSIQEICDYRYNGRSISDIAEENCILWLWTTNAFMRYAYEVLDAWGFIEKTILTWKKDKMGLGDWLRGITEHCIMAIKGRPIINLTNQTTFFEGKAREHSRKPIEFYEMILNLCPGIAIDIFSRERLNKFFPGKIVSLGVEVDKFD